VKVDQERVETIVAMSTGSATMNGKSMWPRLAGLSLVIEACEYERLHAVLAHEFQRVTTHVRLVGAGADGLGEDVSVTSRTGPGQPAERSTRRVPGGPGRRRVCAVAAGSRRRSLMADTVRGVEYYYVTIPDAPGEGQGILSALKESGVNLLAFLGFPLGGGQSQIDLVPEDPQALREAAEQAGATLSEAKRAFLIQGDDRVGAVADTMAKLAAANINLTAAAATGAGSGRFGMILWVATDDYETAAEALGV
jgi:hypothetical protein